MRIAGKWNYKTRRYEPYELPERASCYSEDWNEIIQCAACGKEIAYGEGYCSQTIHTQIGISYIICARCRDIERAMEWKRGIEHERQKT